MKLPDSAGGKTLYLIGSSRGQAELAKHGMTTYDLATASGISSWPKACALGP